ncbi:MAG: NAD-dependent epimerase/dehydratase family protein [Candidatus Verstraetearchaeota archaeon]|nr:NAD-dependent epimerase/dehydratase family protein [Candidatus Verstraetearchaeota archaeon]
MRVAVTGASGFLGGHLLEALAGRGHEVIALVRGGSDRSVIDALGIESRKIDLSDGSGIPESLRGVEALIHLAAYYTFHGKWELYKKINVEGTEILLRAAKANLINHFIYCSTTEVIGPVKVPPGDESAPLRPQHDYGRSKLLAEEVVRRHGREGLECTIIRPSGIYGPRNVDDVSYWTITSFAKNSLATRFVVGSGKNLIQFVHVRDVVQGFVLALEKPEVSVGNTYIISEDRAYTYNEVYSILAELCGRSPPKIHLPKLVAAMAVLPVEGFNRLAGREDFMWHLSTLKSVTQDRSYSIEKAKRQLGYMPRYDLRTGLRETVQWYKENGFI